MRDVTVPVSDGGVRCAVVHVCACVLLILTLFLFIVFSRRQKDPREGVMP